MINVEREGCDHFAKRTLESGRRLEGNEDEAHGLEEEEEEEEDMKVMAMIMEG